MDDELQEWKKPSDVMRKLKAKKRALQKRFDQPENYKASFQAKQEQIALQQCSNPFRCSSQKQLKSPITSPELEWSSDSTFFQLLQPNLKTRKGSEISLTLAETEKNLLTNGQAKGKEIEDSTWTSQLPMDWSLKTKLHFLSSNPFPWNANMLKTTEEASGITGFVRCLHASNNHSQESLDTSSSAKLHQHCLVWMHPSLPWMNLFPRTSGKLTESSASIVGSPQIQQSLHADWCQSLHSLFLLLRARQCPFFYVCNSSFTVMFRSAGVAGIQEIHALLTPTTVGFRTALKEEGIDFTMPLLQDRSAVDSPESSGNLSFKNAALNGFNNGLINGDTTSNSNMVEEESETLSWMEKNGLNSIIGSVDRRKIAKENVVDNSQASLIYVEGIEVQGLYNFLLNSRNCVETRGPLNGIPPTLLSPIAFQGGTLRQVQVKQGIAQTGVKKLYSMEIQGPILPITLPSLMNLLAASESEITVTCKTLEETAGFSAYHNSVSIPLVFTKQSLIDCGTSTELLDLICSERKPTVIHELKSRNRLFSYS